MSEEKLSRLRECFEEYHLDGYLIPKANVHQCEYLGPEDERLKWLTHFSGSAGFCVVLKDRAALFVDGRYILQAPLEVEDKSIEIVDTSYHSLSSWLAQNIPAGARIGFDPWLLTISQQEQYGKCLQEKGATLVSIEINLIDHIWHKRPMAESHKIVVHPLEVAGVSFQEKIKNITENLCQMKADVTLITSLESVNWLFNIRGKDLAYLPVVYAFALVNREGQATLFTDENKVTSTIKSHFGTHVEIKAYDKLLSILESYGDQGLNFLLDPQGVPFKIKEVLGKGPSAIIYGQDLTALPKACKNNIEIEGMRQTHVRDGAALTQFLGWVSQKVASGDIITEVEAAEKLHTYRAQLPTFWGESFPTISATGAHGAIVHYHATQATDRHLQKDDIYLVDSGAHYHDGSTDVTRTMVLGQATSEQKDRFTRVLKGHIALAQAIFPQGTTGSQIDVLARQYLWQAGLDYAHGTGHGVGSVLNIHEGPQRISKVPSLTPLQPGMVISNEPGYYKKDHYGIRIESLLAVVKLDRPEAEYPMLGFETLTMAPIDLKLVEKSLMNPNEMQWLNAYHFEIRKVLMPLVESATQDWLHEVTQAI